MTIRNQTYSPSTIEAQIQEQWRQQNAYRAQEHDPRFPKGKFYACSMLPYPSGKLHMGHVRNYTINDVMYRSLRMQGYNVLMPMGWDAFGMPAENAAMTNGVPPAQWTYANIATMKTQMQAMGLAIDWSREIAACSSDYYRWNQWLFLRMLEKGIAYRKTQIVNWDPVDQTVLANEQVIDGCGWRSGAKIEKREIPGYYLNITAYAEELLADLDGLAWPERVKIMQHNWIGKSSGLRFAFTHTITDTSGAPILDGKMYVFTTRPDTIMGVSFCAVAAEHPLAQHAAKNNPALTQFIEECKQGSVIEADMATMEKKGIDSGLTLAHPLTGKSVPLWIANYVLMSYGDGAVMGVPAHDERDFTFAQKYDLPIYDVIAPSTVTGNTSLNQSWDEARAQHGVCINSGKYDGLDFSAATAAVAADLTALGLGELKTTYRLRDWGISRQRSWGTPIPLIHCQICGVVPVPETELPVILPEDAIPDGTGNPLNKHSDFLNCVCPKCGQKAQRETDTMDTFIDSSWYYMRYCCPDAPTMVDSRIDYWMPMDQYIGGIEHAILHLLYARFWTKVMRDMGLVKCNEPFTQLLTQGMVLNETYYREDANGKKLWFNPAEVSLTHDDKGRVTDAQLISDRQTVSIGGVEKMSKSKNNGIDPQGIIDSYGADTARLFTMFAAPPEHTLEWSNSGVEGAHRFLRRVWTFCQKYEELLSTPTAAQTPSKEIANARRQYYLSLTSIDQDLARKQYNTVVSSNMKILNALEEINWDLSNAYFLQEGVSIFLRTLYPIAPHITCVLWQELGFAATYGELLNAPWPTIDASALEQSEITVVIQVNGKLRGNLTVRKDATQSEIEALALELPAVQRVLTTPAKKIILIKGKLLNIVV